MEDGGKYQISKKDGKYYDPTTKKYYKIPVDTEIKRDNDPNITEGDYVVNADGKITQLNKLPEGTPNLMDKFKYDAKTGIMSFEGISEQQVVRFRTMIQKVIYNTTGIAGENLLQLYKD
jgi:hypothetical protein